MASPAVRRIAIRRFDPQIGERADRPSLFRLGIVNPNGDWESPEPHSGEVTFTEREAWCRAAILGQVTGLPIEDIDFKPDGSIMPTHPAFYTLKGRA